MIKRLENFQKFEKKKSMQDAIIAAKKLNAINSCENVDEQTKEMLISEVEAAQRTKDKIIQEEIKERKELETNLMNMIQDDRIRTIMILHYLQGMSLKDVAVQFGISYCYARELCADGRSILK